MFYLIDYLQKLVGNFGVAILLATVLVKLLVFPLANKSYASMSKMKKLQPEMLKLKELYPDDKMKQQQEMMALYKREKVNPMSAASRCWCKFPFLRTLQGHSDIDRTPPCALLRLDPTISRHPIPPACSTSSA